MNDHNRHGAAQPTPDPRNFAQWRRDVRECLIFLTRLPVSRKAGDPDTPLASAMRAFGLAGAVVGLMSALAMAVALWLGLSSVLASIAALATAALVTGALHEDGLADVADGFGGGATIARKLEIMRDSRIGAYGVLALIVVVATRIFALAAVIDAAHGLGPMLAIIAIAAQSRAFMGLAMYMLPNARADGAAASAGRPTRASIDQLVASTAIISIPLMWWAAGLWAIIATTVLATFALWLFARVCRKQIGGQTGDVLGATQQIIEVVQLLTLAAVLA